MAGSAVLGDLAFLLDDTGTMLLGVIGVVLVTTGLVLLSLPSGVILTIFPGINSSDRGTEFSGCLVPFFRGD